MELSTLLHLISVVWIYLLPDEVFKLSYFELVHPTILTIAIEYNDSVILFIYLLIFKFLSPETNIFFYKEYSVSM